MTHATPIPPDEFADAVARLDETELADFVGALQRAMVADAAVDVDPPLVTVRRDDRQTTLLVRGGAPSGPDRPADVDRIVQPGADVGDAVVDGAVLTLSELREQLLYGLAPEEAETISERFLGTAARSASYADETPATAVSDGAEADETPVSDAGVGSAATPSRGRESTPPDGTTGPPPSSGERRTARTGDDGPRPRAHSTDEPSSADSLGLRRAIVVILVLLVAVGGVASVADRPLTEAASVLSGSGGADEESLAEPTSTSAAPATATTAEPGTSTGAGMEAEVLDEETDGSTASDGETGVLERERNFGPEPTCRRSYLLVTQIQMNALRYNDNETNAGIRTVRRFASPTNRRAVDSFSEYVQVIRSPTYSAMLTYDSVRYAPARVGDRTAQVRVVTRENGTVTGRYEFFLRKIGDGEYEGCWMTDAVLTQSMAVFDAGPVATDARIGV